MMRPVILALLGLLLSGLPATANPVTEARAAYLAEDARQAELAKQIRTLEQQIEEAETRLKTLTQTRTDLVAQVEAQRDKLLQLDTGYAGAIRWRGREQTILQGRWKEMLDNPRVFARAEVNQTRQALATLSTEIAELTAKRAALRPELDKRNEALQAAELDADHTAEVTNLDADIFDMRTRLDLLRQGVTDSLKAQEAAFEAFRMASAETLPPVVDKVRVLGPDGVVFEAAWAPDTLPQKAADRYCGLPPVKGNSAETAPADPAQMRLARDMAEMEATRRTAEDTIKRNDEVIEELTKQIRAYNAQQIALNTRFATLYKEIGELENTNLAIATVIDIGVVIAEVALTGGAATVARKGAELGVDALGKITARELRKQVGDRVSRQLHGKAIKVARREFLDEASRRTRITVQIRGAEAIRKEAADLFDDVAQEAFREHLNKLTTATVGRALVRKKVAAMAADAAPAMQGTAGLRAAKSLATDTVEGGFDKLVGYAAYKGYERLQASGKDWKRVATGLRSLKPNTLRDLVPDSPADVVGIVGATAKAAFAYGVGLEIDERTREAATITAQYGAIYKINEEMFVNRLELRKKNSKLADMSTRAEEELNAIRKGLRTNRRLVILEDAGLSDMDAALQLEVTFSKPLGQAPQLHVGGITLTVEGQSPVGSTVWTAALPMEQLKDRTEEQSIAVEGEDAGGQGVDSSPASLNLPKLSEDGMHFYDPGIDECYRLPIKPGDPLILEFEGLKAEFKIR
ncbi:MAG: hypothetical protein ACPH5G_10780 [Pseudooceanicola atlanticus]